MNLHPTPEIILDYTNHRGVRSKRIVLPVCILFGESQWHKSAQWLLEAMDLEKRQLRTFAVTDIHSWETAK